MGTTTDMITAARDDRTHLRAVRVAWNSGTLDAAAWVLATLRGQPKDAERLLVRINACFARVDGVPEFAEALARARKVIDQVKAVVP